MASGRRADGCGRSVLRNAHRCRRNRLLDAGERCSAWQDDQSFTGGNLQMLPQARLCPLRLIGNIVDPHRLGTRDFTRSPEPVKFAQTCLRSCSSMDRLVSIGSSLIRVMRSWGGKPRARQIPLRRASGLLDAEACIFFTGKGRCRVDAREQDEYRESRLDRQGLHPGRGRGVSSSLGAACSPASCRLESSACWIRCCSC